jgi:hypothetical protein
MFEMWTFPEWLESMQSALDSLVKTYHSLEKGRAFTEREADCTEKSSEPSNQSNQASSFSKTPQKSEPVGGILSLETSWRSDIPGETESLPHLTAVLRTNDGDGSVSVPTPIARDWKSGTGADHGKHSPPLSSVVGGMLNPEWVEWLMGWPIGHTELEHSGMVKFPFKPPSRIES